MKLVLLSGKAGSGKSTLQGLVARSLELRGYRCLKTNFADLLKYICERFLNWDGEKNDEGRLLLQKVGTDIIKAQDSTYWIRFIADMISYFGEYYDYMIIGDCRFEDEITYFKENEIKNLDCVISVRIERERTKSSIISAKNSRHISENALDEYEGFDLTVVNREWLPGAAAEQIVEYIRN